MRNDDRVLFAGAGPVGCTAALYLAQRGVKVTLLEACETLPLDLRASTFHPPTLEMLDDLGVLDPLVAQGIICPVWQYRDSRDGLVAEWDLGVLRNDTRHPYRLQAEQFKLTNIVVDILKTMPGVEVRFSARAVDAEQDADGVNLQIDTNDGRETIRGQYLIAADGASSNIRVSQGIDFPGLTFSEIWLCVSTAFDFTRPIPGLSPIAYVADPECWFVFVKVPDMWRLLMPSFPGETADTLITDETVDARMQRIGVDKTDYKAIHRTAYHVHQRVAETYRKGRIFLAGDSAHINNPLGGMGMNGGIHDGLNLAEKLVRVWRGEAGDDEFDRYDRQRRPIAVEFVQKATLANKAMLEEIDPDIRRAKQDELRRICNDPVAARDFLLHSSMIKTLARAASLG